MGEKEIVPPEYQLPLVLVGISVVALIGAVILLVKTSQRSEPVQFSSDTKKDNASVSAKLTIDVSGAVRSPGVYMLPIGSRVIDAIAIAGGVTSEADIERIGVTINQASILSDGAKVYIPIKNGTNQTETAIPGAISVTTISINTATIDELDTLSGIGPVTAKKIIDNRPYTTLEDLIIKKVMGQSLFDTLKNQLTL